MLPNTVNVRVGFAVSLVRRVNVRVKRPVACVSVSSVMVYVAVSPGARLREVAPVTVRPFVLARYAARLMKPVLAIVNECCSTSPWVTVPKFHV
jgi:hypothetical protein